MTKLEEETAYNIEDYINGRWVTRYRKWMTFEEALEKYRWLTTSDYWLSIAPNYRIIQLTLTSKEVARHKP